jgi:DNA transformation protein
MARRSEFVQLVLDLMAAVGEVRARAMFGGYGIYLGGIMFAIVVDDRLYLKADNATRRAFSDRSLDSFSYVARGRTITMQYYEAPAEVFESAEAMQNWVRPALDCAVRQKSRWQRAQRRRPASPGRIPGR